jgi:hypothetical protein
MNLTHTFIPAGPATLEILVSRARPPQPVRRPAVRVRKAVPVPVEAAVPGSAAAVSEWLAEIRRSNVAEDRFRLLLWVASWGALLLAFVG